MEEEAIPETEGAASASRLSDHAGIVRVCRPGRNSIGVTLLDGDEAVLHRNAGA
jgi:hypothetical protein